MSIKHVLLALLLLIPATAARAVCHDTVVMVHGNTGSPGDFVNTYNLLRQKRLERRADRAAVLGQRLLRRLQRPQRQRGDPGEERHRQRHRRLVQRQDRRDRPLDGRDPGDARDRQARRRRPRSTCSSASPARCTACGRCGIYPFNVSTSTCGYYGLSVHSPFLDLASPGTGSACTCTRSSRGSTRSTATAALHGRWRAHLDHPRRGPQPRLPLRPLPAALAHRRRPGQPAAVKRARRRGRRAAPLVGAAFPVRDLRCRRTSRTCVRPGREPLRQAPVCPARMLAPSGYIGTNEPPVGRRRSPPGAD